jgi:hypothetical protein
MTCSYLTSTWALGSWRRTLPEQNVIVQVKNHNNNNKSVFVCYVLSFALLFKYQNAENLALESMKYSSFQSLVSGKRGQIALDFRMGRAESRVSGATSGTQKQKSGATVAIAPGLPTKAAMDSRQPSSLH